MNTPEQGGWPVGGPPPPDTVTVRTIQLDKIRLGLSFMTSKLAVLGARMDAKFVDDMIHYQLRGFLWGERAGRYTFTAPSDWWQALRERWWPRWALTRWPVKYRREVIEVTAIYPDLKISLPEDAKALVIQRVDDWPVVQ